MFRTGSRLVGFYVAIGCAIVLVPALSAQTTYYVDDDAPADPCPGDPSCSDPLENGSAAHPFDAIQEGIDASSHGDTVLVLDGTYTGNGNRDISLGGRLITVRSENGPDKCVINCEGTYQDPHRGFSFVGVTSVAVVDGFTITNGNARRGGGIVCDRGSPTITNCAIVGNRASAIDNHGKPIGEGGGIYCSRSSPTITNCTIAGNSSNQAGGGIYCTPGSNPSIQNCTVSGNYADAGGGMLNSDCSPTVTDCIFSGNSATVGAGMANNFGAPKVTDCIFSANRAGWGAGMENAGGSTTVTRCIFSGNEASVDGGGMRNYGGDPTVTNCIFIGNKASSAGGAMDNFISCPTVKNSTFSGNAADLGGAISTRQRSTQTLTNCTFVGNLANNGRALACDSMLQRVPSTVRISNSILWDDGDEVWNNDGSTITISYSDVQGGWTGEGNINADPLFVDPAERDYHLTILSPCVNAGDPNFVAAPGETDMDTQMRVWGRDANGLRRVDMGADEFGSYASGDLNCDGAFNGADIDLFFLALGDPAAYAVAFPNCAPLLADMDCDLACESEPSSDQQRARDRQKLPVTRTTDRLHSAGRSRPRRVRCTSPRSRSAADPYIRRRSTFRPQLAGPEGHRSKRRAPGIITPAAVFACHRPYRVDNAIRVSPLAPGG